MGRMLSVVVFQEFSADVLLIIIEFRSLASKLEYFDHCSLCFNEESFWLKSIINGNVSKSKKKTTIYLAK